MKVARLICCVTVVLSMTALSALSQARGVFKGTWQGPSSRKLPGPGPSAGQSLEDYLRGLKTGQRTPAVKHVLVLGGSRGFHHDSISPAMAAVLRWGMESGNWEAELRTGFELVNASGGAEMNAGFQPVGLGDFDAVVVVSAEGDWGLNAQQKASLISFVHDKGKGLVVVHAGLAANPDWRDWIDMVGGEMTGHPFNDIDHVLRPFAIENENPDHPVVAGLPQQFVKQDELYAVRNFSRTDTDVLLRLNESALDYAGVEDQVPPDHDFPIAWTKRFGKGRVFASSLGHSKEAFTDPDIARLYEQGIRWALGLTSGGIGPHPRPSAARIDDAEH